LTLGEHGSTFAGGAITARAALVALEIVSDPALLESVRTLGDLLERRCLEISGVELVRRRGLMVGLGLSSGIDAGQVARRALDRGLIVNAPNPSTVRLLPPLVIAEAEIERGAEMLATAVGDVVSARA
jgi:acetylornithine aminotransferase